MVTIDVVRIRTRPGIDVPIHDYTVKIISVVRYKGSKENLRFIIDHIREALENNRSVVEHHTFEE